MNLFELKWVLFWNKSIKEKKEDIEALKKFVETMAGVVNKITDFQETVRNIPALTTKFKKAQKHATSVLGELVADLKISIDQGNDILSQIKE